MPPKAPKHRSSDRWHAYVEGAAILAIAVALHVWVKLPEHQFSALCLLAGARLPNGRVRDGRRWALATKIRTEEHTAKGPNAPD